MSYPVSIFLILVSVLCESFAFDLYIDLLPQYLSKEKVEHLTDNTGFRMYYISILLVNFFPILGAMIADSWLGKYLTIIFFNIIYILGQLVLFITTFYDINRNFIIVAMFLTAMGAGGIRACIQAIGGDQFTLPQQKNHITNFFWFYYFMRLAGSLISFFVIRVIPKKLASDYTALFSIPFAITIFSLVIFAVGVKMYKRAEFKKNIIMKVNSCTWHAISRKTKLQEVRNHWLDYADDRYDQKLIEDTKLYYKVCMILIPLPFFWILHSYANVLWINQINRTYRYSDYRIFVRVIKLKMITMLILIPATRFIIYPIIRKIMSINTPLRKMTVGGILVGIASIISGLLELYVKPSIFSRSIYLMLPRFIVFGIGEVMISVTGMEFIYTQAPLGMKSWLQGFWLLNIGIGDIISYFLPFEQLFEKPTSDFFLFAGLTFGFMFIFALIARKYNYVENSGAANSDNNNTGYKQT